MVEFAQLLLILKYFEPNVTEQGVGRERESLTPFSHSDFDEERAKLKERENEATLKRCTERIFCSIRLIHYRSCLPFPSSPFLTLDSPTAVLVDMDSYFYHTNAYV